MNELGHIAMLAEAFPVEISVWDADMIVRGLVCWSRDPYWKTIDPDDADTDLGELRDLEQRINAAIPERTKAFYDHLHLSWLLEDEASPGIHDYWDEDDGPDP